MAIRLSDSLRVIDFRFVLSRRDLVPLNLLQRERLVMEQRNPRREDPTAKGVLAIQPTAQTSVGHQFIYDLLAAKGYELVDAFCHQQDGAGYVVRFVFGREQAGSDLSDEPSLRQALTEDLVQLAQHALWQVRAFSNPLFCDGKVVVGQKSASFNFNARSPLKHPDGSQTNVVARNRLGIVADAILPIPQIRACSPISV